MRALSVFQDSSVVAAGCYRSTGIAQNGNNCDITFARISNTTGALLWARVFGGTLDDFVFHLAILPFTEEVFYLAGSSSSPGLSSVSSRHQMIVSKHSSLLLVNFNSLDGILLSFKII
jgi:hypothetical protein